MSQPPQVPHRQRHYHLSIRDISPDGRPLVTIEVLAVESGLHPELVRRLVALGALEPLGGTRSQPRYPRDAAAILARIVRLRGDLGLNYAGALLANELLARIQSLESQLRGLLPGQERQPPDSAAAPSDPQAQSDPQQPTSSQPDTP